LANNYCQFSETLTDLTKVEVKWLVELSECLLALETEDYSTNGRHFDAKGKPKTSLGRVAEGIFKECDRGGINLEGDNGAVWFRSEENDDPAVVAWVVFRFFQEFDKTDAFFALQWADFCDKLRVGEFGGGAYLVTHKGVWAMTTGDWVRDELKKRGLVKEEETG
jgi:hypothetical protein